VAIYEIFFDTDRADVKTESTPTLDEIAKLLGENPSMKLWVVGHTDAQGALAHNMDLSKRRAESVVKILTAKYKVAAARIGPSGVGPLAPVATNKTDEGRAKNRRVELVEQ
jgi:outer membrane protein OmpA-like peptidoglycan-associated protein